MRKGLPMTEADDDCIHGLDPRTCSTCLHGVSRPERPTVEYRFVAKHEGQCPECDLPIHVGDPVAKMSTGAYLHVWCAPAAGTPGG
jgi:hypothetical protein